MGHHSSLGSILIWVHLKLGKTAVGWAEKTVWRIYEEMNKENCTCMYIQRTHVDTEIEEQGYNWILIGFLGFGCLVKFTFVAI